MQKQKVLFQYPSGEVVKTVCRKIKSVTSDGYNQFGEAVIDGKTYKVKKPTGSRHWFTTNENWL